MSDWFFPLLGGGEEQGLNESGIQTFKKASALGRETCQNIGDVRDGSGKPAIATFELIHLPIEEFPGLEQFKKCFESCRDYVLAGLKDGTGNEKEFFRNGIKILNSKTIPVLRIGDENTTGLVGDDSDRTKPFFRLLKQQGSSSAQGVGGGTYGIGQRAPFAHSALRTVFYSTKTPDGNAFIAKSILASFPHPEGSEITQAKGWWCEKSTDGKSWNTIRQTSTIPKRFLRENIGTDLWVVGFNSSDWEKSIRHSILENFFAAIENNQLVVKLKESDCLLSEISSGNLDHHLKVAAEEAFSEQNHSEYTSGLGSTVYFHKALVSPLNGEPFTTEIAKIGTVKLYLYRDNENKSMPDRWAKMRSPRIIVQHHGSRLLSNFAAVLICDNEDGNQYLAQLEGATHECWDIEETRNWSTEQKNEAKKVLNSINAFVRNTLKKVRGENLQDEEDIPFLGRYLPSEDDGTNTKPGNELTGQNSDQETGEKRSRNKKAVVQVTAAKLPRPSANEQDDKPSSGKKGKKASKGEKSPSGGKGKSAGSEGAGQGKKQKVFDSTVVNFRSFISYKKYKIILTAKKDLSGILKLKAIGEDNDYPINITKAISVDNGEHLSVSDSQILGINLIKGQKTTLLVDINSDTELCLSMGN
ncbi:hypothetical protein [Spongorhabdus nitratireducens]